MVCLFVDLDGVLVDFDSGVAQLTGKFPSEQHPRHMWPRLAREKDFYANLSWLDGGRVLWDSVQHLHPTILTGLPMGRWAEPQKRAWCARELGPGVPVETCMSRHKASRARDLTPDGAQPVLIDDRLKLQEAWEAMGGVFIHYQDPTSALERLTAFDGEFTASLR